MAEDTSRPADASGEPDRLIGTEFAEKYEIVDCLGSGGTSSVYKARHTHIGSFHALKVLFPQFIRHDQTLKRFQQEAKAASMLQHANVIRVLDFGVTDEQQPYMVMEYIKGQSVGELVKKNGAFSPERTLEIMIEACEALAHAHKKGIVHRDMKPSNIMIGQNEQGEEVVKIVDFGIAKLHVMDGDDMQALTQTGEVFGSPFYMSPEQCKAESLDHRSDIYSMGCVMYEMLTGRPPLKGGNVLETMYKHMNEMPEGLGKTVKDAHLREQLESVIFRAMAKDPKARYPDMDWFLTDLKAIQRGEGKRPLARIKSILELMWLKRVPKKQRPFWQFLLVTLILSGAIGWAVHDALLATPDVKLPAVDWKPEIVVKPRGVNKAKRINPTLFNMLMNSSSDELKLKALEARANQDYAAGEYDEAIVGYKQALDLRLHTGEKDRPTVGLVLDEKRIGDCAYYLKDYDTMQYHYDYCVKGAAGFAASIPGFKEIYYILADTFRQTGDAGQAAYNYGKYIEAYHDNRFSQAAHTPQIAMAWSRKADMLRQQIDFAGEKIVVERCEKEVESNRKNVARLKGELEDMLKNGMAESSEDVEKQRRSITYVSGLLSVSLEKLKAAREDLEVAKSKKRFRINETETAYGVAANEWKPLDGFEFNMGVARFHQGEILEMKNKPQEAEEAYKESLSIIEKQLPADDTHIATVAKAYSDLLWTKGNWMESLKLKMKADGIMRAYMKRVEPSASNKGKGK